MRHVYDSPTLDQVADQRDGKRYLLKARVDVSRESKPAGLGELFNISRSGAAFRAHAPMDVSGNYSVRIEGFGEYPCTIIRRFDTNSYGIRFDVNSDAKIRLEKKIKALINAGADIVEAE